jgi:hypothetical protein
LRTSKAATEPPHAEHGWLDPVSFGHAIKPPTAELRVKVLSWTLRNSPPLPPVADTAPPLAALQLTKTQCDTVTLLSTADTAPPLPFMLEQLSNVMSTIVTVELLMLKAAPFACSVRRLQSKTVAAGAPLMTSDNVSAMRTVVSLKTPEVRSTSETPTS